MFKLIDNPFIDIPFDGQGLDLSAAQCKTIQPPDVWAESNFYLPEEGYGEYGPMTFVGRNWQREILRAFLKYHVVITVGAVQVGKSVAGVDIPWAWFNDQVGGRSLLVYADKDTVKDVFEEKLKPIIKTNLKHLWSGRDDDIRQDKIILRSGISRCASCNVKNDLATFPAKFVLCDEVAKWKTGTRNAFDAIGQAIGRTRDYHGSPGIDYRVAIVSSPVEVNDALYNQIYVPGTLVLKYKMPCLGCGYYHELCVENIHERPNDKEVKDHDPNRIRIEKAADYICPQCGRVIADNERYEMDARGVWATEDEQVIGGFIIDKSKLRDTADRICFWTPGRLVSRPEKYPFYECLAGYFQAKYSPDHKAWQNYWNEDLARFYRPDTKRVSEGFIRGKIESSYTSTGPIPDGVLVAVGGIDTQDTEFYFSIVGYGRYMETWILRYGRIPCDMNMSEFKDPQKVLDRFRELYFANQLTYTDGRVLPVLFTMIDEGGHRERDVQFICKNHRDIAPYKGAGSSADLIRKSQSKNLWLGNTESFSKLVEKDMNSSTWHLPSDVSQEFIDQIQRQYTKEETDKNGNVKYVWVSGGEDHYRDCLDYALAAAHILELPGRLNNEHGIKQIENTVHAKSSRDAETQANTRIPTAQVPAQTANNRNVYNPFTARPRMRSWGGRR
jgi:phage terminase large subunit GpA-like protein